MIGVNDKVVGVIRSFLDLCDKDQGQAMEVLSEYYIADSDARGKFVSAVRDFARDSSNKTDFPKADLKPRHHKMY
jgi:hypothetical protein